MFDTIDIAIYNLMKKSFIKLLSMFGIPTGGNIPLIMFLALVYIFMLAISGRKVKK